MHKRNNCSDQRGFIMVLLAAGLMVVLCAIAGLAIDVGRAYVVKGQLQNAADAAALAGAGELYRTTTTPPSLDWSNARKAVKSAIESNSADGKALTDCDIDTGYWNLSLPNSQSLQSPGTKSGVCSDHPSQPCNDNSDCPPPEGCLQMNAPAVKVTVEKAPGKNHGPVRTVFAKVVGWDNFRPVATAVALSGAPGAMPKGMVFPFAVNECVKDDFLSGRITSGTTVTLTSALTTSKGSKLGGQWTNLTHDRSPDANGMKGYLYHLLDEKHKEARPSPEVRADDQVYIDPGAMGVLYHVTGELIAAGKGRVLMPVVACDIVPGSFMKVRGFIGMRLTSADSTSLSGRFETFYPLAAGPGPGGETTNTVILPKLVR